MSWFVIRAMVLFLSSAWSSSDVFLKVKYGEQLTTQNLCEFFKDWEAYSYRISNQRHITDHLMGTVLDNEIDIINRGIRRTSHYRVVPQRIRVITYNIDIDTTRIFSFSLQTDSLESLLPDTSYVMPPLKDHELYLSPNIDKMLTDYLDMYNSIGFQERRDSLLQYIEYLNFGFLNFLTIPYIYCIHRANNVIAIERRTFWESGDEIWYLIEGDEIKRLKQPRSCWIS